MFCLFADKHRILNVQSGQVVVRESAKAEIEILIFVIDWTVSLGKIIDLIVKY